MIPLTRQHRLDTLTAALRGPECLICGARPGCWCDGSWPVPAGVIRAGRGGDLHVPRVLSAVTLGHVSAGMLRAQFAPGQVPAWLSSPVRR